MTKRWWEEYLNEKDWSGLAKAYHEEQQTWHKSEWQEFVQAIEDTATRKAYEAFEEMIGEDEASDIHENEPQWCKCGNYPHDGQYCSNCRRKVIFKTEKYSTSSEMDRNNLRQNLRDKLHRLQEEKGKGE